MNLIYTVNMLNRKLHMVVTAVVLLGACAWLPFALMSKDMNVWIRITVALIGILGFIILFERDMYLPFLADTAFPTSLLSPTQSFSNTVGTGQVAVTIGKLPPNSKVIYWAAEAGDPRGIGAKDWKEAYGEYANAGVAKSNESGVVTIVLRCPQAYNVSHFGIFETELPPHVHYRYELQGTKGMLSEVFTHEVNCIATQEK